MALQQGIRTQVFSLGDAQPVENLTQSVLGSQFLTEIYHKFLYFQTETRTFNSGSSDLGRNVITVHKKREFDSLGGNFHQTTKFKMAALCLDGFE